MSDSYISIWSQIASYILELSSIFRSGSTTNILCPFQISSKPPSAIQLSRHTLSTVFFQCFEISVVFQNQHFDLFGCRVDY